MNSDTWVTLHEASQLTGKSTEALRMMIRRKMFGRTKKITSKQGKVWAIHREEIDRLTGHSTGRSTGQPPDRPVMTDRTPTGQQEPLIKQEERPLQPDTEQAFDRSFDRTHETLSDRSKTEPTGHHDRTPEQNIIDTENFNDRLNNKTPTGHDRPDIAGDIKNIVQQAVETALENQQLQLTKPLEQQAMYIAGALTQENNELRAQKETLLREIEHLQQQIKMLPAPVEQIAAQIETLHADREVLTTKVNNLETETETLRKQIEQTAREKEAETQDKERLAAELQEARLPWWKKMWR